MATAVAEPTTNGAKTRERDTAPTFLYISIDMLAESPLNTRKHFDKAKLEEKTVKAPATMKPAKKATKAKKR